MNKAFKVVFNHSTGTFQAVQETAKGQHKTQTSQSNKTKTAKVLKAVLRPLTMVVSVLTSALAVAAPTGGQVTAGVANIAQTGTITNINQSSQNAAINWQSFNVGKNETVNFNQPNAGSVTLNRVIGNERSVIDGAMNASGKVFISNANGMLIGKDAKINVGSLVATTANISDNDLMNGRYSFAGEGAGSIENLGKISVPKGGVVALVAPIVKNGGTITAHDGNVLLASAESFSITLPDNANFAYTLDKGTLQGLVDNGGAILADSGRVVLTAKGVDTVKKSLIKHTGKIEANTVQNKNGVIELLGDLDNSALNVSGSLKAEGKGDDKGGFIETSSAQLNFDDSAVISTKSETGQTGTWLIDPKDFTVAPSGGDITGAKVSEGLQSNNITLKSRDGAKEGKGDVIINDEISWDKNTFTLNAENDIHINKTLNGTGTAKLALEYGQGTSDGGESDYYLGKNTPLKDRKVKVNLPEGKTFSVKKGSEGKTIDYTVFHTMPTITTDNNGNSSSSFYTHYIAFGKDMDLSYTKNYKEFAGWKLHSEFRPQGYSWLTWANVMGLGHTIHNLNLNNTKSGYTGLFASGSGTIRDVGLLNVNIFSNNGYYVGGLIGNGNRISDSYVTGNLHKIGENSHTGGLAGLADNVSNSYAKVNITTTGDSIVVGGLVGLTNRTIKNSYATGNINTEGSSGRIGGLTGWSFGSITNSYATGNIQSTGRAQRIGGLAGEGEGIFSSYATGNVSELGDNGSVVGGLVGRGENIAESYSLGNVYSTGSYSAIGGLAGFGINISNSYTIGDVHSKGEYSDIGGLVGRGKNISNSYANNKVLVTGQYSKQGGFIGGSSPEGISNSFFNQTKQPNMKGVWSIQSPYYNITTKTDTELRTPSTFKDWDFENVWYMNKNADGTYSYPMLRAFAQTLTVNPTPTPPTAQTTAGVKAPDLSKTYDGKAITSVDDLKKLDGWKDNFDATGLATGDSVDGIFKAGTLTIDESKGDWKGAKDVKEGGYELYPTGTLKDEYQQKYIIEWNKGTLTINPAKLTITAMNNIKPEGENNPDVSRIGVVVTGLVEGESISDVNLSYSDDKKWQGDISIIRVGEPVFSNGKASNYEITKNHGKLLTVQREYDLNNITDKKPEDVAKIRDLLNAVEDEMLLAHAVYGSDSAKKGDNDRFYEIWEVKDNKTGVITKEKLPLNFDPKKDGKSDNTYYKLYELVNNYDYSAGTVYLVDYTKVVPFGWSEKLLSQDEYDKLVRSGYYFELERTFRDGLYPSDKVKSEHSDKTTDYNGLSVGVYKNTENGKHYIVFRGTDTTGNIAAVGRGETDTNNTLNVIDPVGFDGIADSDGATNSEQGLGKLPLQYQRAKEIVQELVEKNPKLDWTIVGHSLGGGLATYSSTQNKKGDGVMKTVVFNPAQLHANNIIGANENVPSGSGFLNTYAKNKFIFGNVNTYVFDRDILQLNNKFASHISLTRNAYIGNKEKIDFFTTDSMVDDHLMMHIIKTQQLADIMANNNEILANCQANCIKLQEHQWTPAPKLAETKKSAGDTIRYNNEVGNTIRQTLGDKADEIVGNVGLLDPTKPIAVVTNSDTIFTTNGKIVSVERGEGLGKQIFALKEWNVENGDIIRTADKKVTIQFSDGSWVELAPYTMVRIDFSHKKDGDDDLIANYLVLHKGQGQILTKGTKKPE